MPERTHQLMVMSIRPRFVGDILAGRKSVELRRTRPLVGPGQPVAIYSTVPSAEIVALAEVRAVSETFPTTLWNEWGSETGLARREFREYFAGCKSAIGIHLTAIQPLVQPVALAHLKANGNFQPPQTWSFLGESDVRSLLGAHLALPQILRRMGRDESAVRRAMG